MLEEILIVKVVLGMLKKSGGLTVPFRPANRGKITQEMF